MPIRGPRGSLLVGSIALMNVVTASWTVVYVFPRVVSERLWEVTRLPVVSRLNTTPSMLRAACAAPPPCKLTLLMPTNGQNALGWLRTALSVMFSMTADGGLAPTGVDVGNVMVAEAAGTPLATR